MKEDFRKYYTEDEVTGRLRRLIAVPSHKDVPGREAAVGDVIFDECRDLGFETEKYEVADGRCNVYARLRGTGGGPTLLLNGHMDTVPPYEMVIDPFAGEIRDGCMWGRGTTDMKGALACMMTAMAAIKRSGIRLKGDVLFTAVVGEEGESDGTEAFVVNGGKADAAIVGEPSEYGFSFAHRGLETLEIKVYGTTMHGSQALRGVNAIRMASRLIERIDKELFPKIIARTNEYMGPALMNYGKIFGGDQICTVAGECTIQLDRRYVPGETVDSLIAEYQGIIDELHAEDPAFRAEISRMPNSRMKYLAHAPLWTDPDEKIVGIVKKILAERLGEEPDTGGWRGWTDAGMLSTFGHIPTVVFGPGSLADAHTKDEHVSLEQLFDYVSFYAQAAAEFCGVE